MRYRLLTIVWLSMVASATGGPALAAGEGAPSAAPQTATPAAPQGPPPTVVTVEQYRNQLDQADRRLKSMEKRPPRPVVKVLGTLPTNQTVRRSDGTTQTFDTNEWTRRSCDITGSATADDVRNTRAALAAHRKALDEWAKIPAYEPPDARHYVEQFVATGQIRVEPTGLQKFWTNVKNWFKDTVLKRITKAIAAFFDWLGNLFPRNVSTPSGSLPDLTWLGQILVVASIAGVLYLVWLLVSKAFVAHKWQVHKHRSSERLDDDDEELLQLPPDELRSRALALAESGDYRQALRHLYIATLVNLERRGVWRYDTRRTNWEHIAGLRRQTQHRPLVAPLSSLTRRFDRVRYGNAPCDQRDWQRFLQETDDLGLSGNTARAN